MRKLALITIILFAGIICLARPAFRNGQYYVWNSDQQAVAQAALDYINLQSGIFPITQKHTKTTIPSWCPALMVRTDGKFCFPRVPEALLDKAGIPEATRELFFTAFQPTVEVYQDDWFDQN